MESSPIRTAGAGDVECALAVQCLAFCADPIMRWLFPDPDRYLAVFPSFARAFGGAAFEHGGAYLDEDAGGAAFWLPEGVSSDAEQIVAILQEEVRESIRDDVFGMLEEMERYHTDEPHDYLAMIGVEPARRGRGLGSALLQARLRDCDGAGRVAYLESSNPANVPLYQRHGFEVIGEIQLGDSPPLFPMIRTP